MKSLSDILGLKAKAVANEFLDLAEASKNPLTQIKLMKLVYLAHGWSLGLDRGPLFNDKVQAWKFGPVIPSIYHEFKDCGGGPISHRAEAFGTKLSDEERELVRRVWEVYGKYSAYQLSNMTHDPDGPWSKTYDSSAKDVVIPNDAIQAYFAQKAQG